MPLIKPSSGKKKVKQALLISMNDHFKLFSGNNLDLLYVFVIHLRGCEIETTEYETVETASNGYFTPTEFTSPRLQPSPCLFFHLAASHLYLPSLRVS